jgi:hypothetical protein
MKGLRALLEPTVLEARREDWSGNGQNDRHFHDIVGHRSPELGFVAADIRGEALKES